MAVQKAIARVSFKDIGGNITTRSYELAAANYGGTILVSELEANCQALVTALQGVTLCGIASIGLELTFAATAPSVAQAESEMENTAALSLPLTVAAPSGLTTFGLLSIPAPYIAIFEGSSGLSYNIVDMDDAEVLALIDLFQVGGSADWTMSDGQTVKASLDEAYGYRVHRRSKRSRGRRVG